MRKRRIVTDPSVIMCHHSVFRDPSERMKRHMLADLGSGVLFPQTNEKKSKKSKITDVGSSGTKVKPTSSSKSPKQVPVVEAEPIQPEPIIADTQLTEKEVIPSKIGVFRRIKMKSKLKHKGRSSITNIVCKPQVSHQGVIFREVPAPASLSSKK
ncbi:unnamed protein product [Lactuca saligna]|uniref:Uncharacterized protein n=1 Tax=Lactuca saligna TaxID=75948 RepID=A0AA35VDA5_LACSI|nr:unnamed protein product [Lactuca saligna]